MIVETEHQVVAVQVKTPVFGSTVTLGRTVAALVSEESHVGHKAETIAHIERNTRTETDTILHSACLLYTSPSPRDS